ncbi:MAG: protein translocase subunit SecD [Propionibacteriaceae bacterium]|nr:protein translocase subunit SecD [Propionibacteriaceae bacterium]
MPIIVFFAVLVLLAIGMVMTGTYTPKLGLDLSGGTTITLTARNETGSGSVDADSLEQARSIIEQRVNSLGVGETSVTTSGDNQIVVSAPNVQSNELVDMVGTTAQLQFRRVYSSSTVYVATEDPTIATEFPTIPDLATDGSIVFTAADGVASIVSQPHTVTTLDGITMDDAGNLTISASGYLAGETVSWRGALADGTESTEQATVTADDSGAISFTWENPPAAADNEYKLWLTRTLTTDETDRETLFQSLMAWTPDDTDTTNFSNYTCGDASPDIWDQPLMTCLGEDQLTDAMKAAGYQEKYLLGPVILEGQRVTEAGYGIPSNQVAYVVTLSFDSLGTKLFGEATTTLYGETGDLNRFAIVLDGRVMSAPTTQAQITGGSATISGGNMTQQSSRQLATVLNYGALPLSFELGNVSNVSASLGADQLRAGLIAGAIGLALVLIYSFVYYRGLGVVVVASLVVAAIANYLLIVLLGEAVGFALSLPGIAGIIVAVGITADSFVIFFERVRDEAREGRGLKAAVETGWLHARRTIVVADCVSLLSAVILYILSIGAVQGFAFALGLTTAIDLAIVFFCTKPFVSLLVQTKFFGEGRKGSGLEAEHLGVSPTRVPKPRRTLATAGKEA